MNEVARISAAIPGTAEPAYAMTFSFTATSEKAFTGAAIAHLRALGYGISEPGGDWETNIAFRHRVGLCNEALQKAIAHPDCPGVVLERGPTGRIIRLRSNAAFDAFCVRNKK